MSSVGHLSIFYGEGEVTLKDTKSGKVFKEDWRVSRMLAIHAAVDICVQPKLAKRVIFTAWHAEAQNAQIHSNCTVGKAI